MEIVYVFCIALAVGFLVAYTQVRETRPAKAERVKDQWAWQLNARWTRWN